MRLSPAFLALMTISAAWGFCDRAQGQTLSESSAATAVSAVEPASAPAAADHDAAAPASVQPDLHHLLTPAVVISEAVSAPVAMPTQRTIGNTRSDNPGELAADALGEPMSLEDLATPDDTATQVSQVPEDAFPPTAPEDAEDPETPGDAEAPEDIEAPEDTDASDEIETPTEMEDEDTEDGEDAQPSPDPLEDSQQEAEEEPRVLVAEVEVIGVDEATLPPELEDEVYDAISTRPGRDTTRSQLQQDINSIFETGFFANVQAVPEDTPLGVRVTFVVQPNPILRTVEVTNTEVLPPEVVDEIFADQYGRIINLIDFQNGILALNQWYQDNGYVLAEVTAAPRVAADGTVTLIVAEGVIDNIDVRFLNSEGSPTDDEGNPVQGVTRDFIVTREFESQPGDVFNESDIQQDLERVFGLGIFDDVRLSLERVDNRRVNVVVNVIERSTGSVAAGLGFNFTGDLFGTVSYRQDNFGGNNQKFSAETQLSFRDLLFDVSFTDPWIAGDPNRTSYTVNAFSRRSISLVFDNGPIDVDLVNGDEVRVNRFGAGVTFGRPLGGGWSGSLGTQVQRVSTRFAGGSIATADELGNPLSLSGIGQDDLWTVRLGLVRDLRNNSLNPTQGSILRVSTEQSIPLGLGNIFLNRVQASYSYYIPVSLINFTDGPQAFAFNVQGGTVLGDLPPYEAFALGGTNSVRGFSEGGLASGRSYLQASAEYRFPIFSFIGGAFFVDAATDLGSGFAVLGSPGPVRGKQGSGFGYGAGVRVQTPLGPLRVDYGFNDNGEGRIHFGIGERF
ncbi:MAG: BamA/TamA family outer membrane protein [Cyanobacteria bacterium J06635_15]